MNIEGLSLSALLFELNTKILGGRIEKLFQPDKHTLVLWIRQPGETFRLLICSNPEQPRVHITEDVLENPITPPAFCMLLRKHLEDTRISAIEQHGLDRVIQFTFDFRLDSGMIDQKILFVELMGKHSNIILTYHDVVLDSIKRVGPLMSSYRQVSPGTAYIYPPGQDKVNLLLVPVAEFIDLVRSLHGTLVKAIVNTALGVGTLTARELVWRAGLPENVTVESLGASDWDILTAELQEMIQLLLAGKSVPTVAIGRDNRLCGIAAFALEHLNKCTQHQFADFSKALAFAAALKGSPIINPLKVTLSKLLQGEISRLLRKQVLIEEELVQANAADDLRKFGDILMANIYNIDSNAASVTLHNIYSDDVGSMLNIDLDPLLSPTENAQHYYAKYSKYKRAQQLLSQQLAQASQEIIYLESILVSLDHANKDNEISEIYHELVLNRYIKDSRKKKASVALSKPLTIITSDGSTVFVGKNNRQNDFITFKQARSDDWWFHTKDIPGSHVLLRVDKGNDPSSNDLLQSAMLAAYYSKARDSSNVPVDYTRRKNVKKPAGAKPGFVIYEKQMTLYVTPDEALLKQLINASE